MSTTNYRLLFKLELLHKFFKDQLCPDFIISPSDTTKDKLQGHKIVAKQYKNELYAGVELDNTGKPMPTLGDGAQLTFFLHLNNPLFLNYTNLPFTSPLQKVYYFTNRNNNISNGKSFLSNIYPAFDAAKEYKPGDLTINATGTVFEASRTSTNEAPPATDTPSDFWIQVDPSSSQNHYMSEEDALKWLPAISTYYFTSEQFAADIKVFGYKSGTDDYSELIFSNLVGFAKPVMGFSLNLSHLLPGKYKLIVNGSEQLIYINDELARKSVFAIVDIFNESTLPANYKIMNGDSLINPSPAFSIYFLNRSTIWKYVLPNGVSGVITDSAGSYDFPAVPLTDVHSISPIPLFNKPFDFKLKVGADPSVLVASASPERLTRYVNAGDTYYCSEIFLNY